MLQELDGLVRARGIARSRFGADLVYSSCPILRWIGTVELETYLTEECWKCVENSIGRS